MGRNVSAVGTVLSGEVASDENCLSGETEETQENFSNKKQRNAYFIIRTVACLQINKLYFAYIHKV
jgi:hypothetical protein